ncbi:MAG: hypothetical protein QOE08_1309, partial [Thermoleophilaceae bacterium]|nr:hypothetical protein [Thermoleophilaceae bacterium]
WSKQCTRNPDGTWTCPNPTAPGTSLPPLSDQKYQRMKAQVENDAKGWNSPEYAPFAESEPVDPKLIKGNYTHGGMPAHARYKLTVPISMANDYNGYIATYREYQRGDHYRKALTGWGPHSSDYMATRLVFMGGQLKDPSLRPPDEPGQEKVVADNALENQKALALGTLGNTSIKAYEAALPDDGGKAGPLEQPKDIQRFAAAFFSWNGGDNFTDNPQVRVQRRGRRGRWSEFADQSGELPVTLKFPQGEDVPSYLTGGHQWKWTAHFEAFASNFDTGSGLATPAGTYRFVVRGLRRQGHAAKPYSVVSKTFDVSPWSGITADDLRVGGDGTVSYRVGPRHTFDSGGAKGEVGPIDYPDSYKSPIPFIKDERTAIRDPAAPNDPSRFEWYCFACSFRPWADFGDARTGYVTAIDARGRHRVRAVRRGDRWYARRAVCGSGSAYVAAGGVRDRFGNRNGAASERVSGTGAPCSGVP